MCFLVISRSGLFIFVYVKPHLLIFSNTSFRLYSHSTPTLSLCQSSTTTIHLYPTATLRPMLYTCSFFTTYLTLILYTFYQQPHTTILPQLFNNHFWQHFRFFSPPFTGLRVLSNVYVTFVIYCIYAVSL